MTSIETHASLPPHLGYRTTGKHPGGMCSSGKVFYRDEWKAKLALVNAVHPPEGWIGEWDPCRSYYLCPECGNWHLTHLEPDGRSNRGGLS